MKERSLEEQLTASQRTVAALTRRLEESVASGESAFAVLEQSIALERVVREKTRQLETQAAELQRTLDRLRAAQAELLQSQKLESVGRLASGIAHEINTPVQFVSDSIAFVQDAAKDLFRLVERYQAARAAAAGRAPPELLAELEAAEQDCDVAYLKERVPAALERSVEGLERVATLVRSMKDFAHPEQREASPADLNRALASTLTIARNEYKYVAEVETAFGDLPPVSCHVGELNQAFLNIIVNAAHAIDEARRRRGTQERGRIRVETRRDGEAVVVAISDTGTGIPEGIQGRIFDPFFTTKEVGKGTGQGLPIARSVVVDKHHGSLTFETGPDRGTTFFIRLPVNGGAEA